MQKAQRAGRSIEKTRGKVLTPGQARRVERDAGHMGEAKAAGIVPRSMNEFEAAYYLGMKVTTLRAWRVRGGGPKFCKVGVRTIRYPVSELDAFLEKLALRETTSTPSPAA